MALAEFYFLRTRAGTTVWQAHYLNAAETAAAVREARRMFGQRVRVDRRQNVMVNFSARAGVSVVAWPCS